MREYDKKQNKLESRAITTHDTAKRNQLKKIVDNRMSLYPLQCYKLVLGGKVKMSENEKYSTLVGDENKLHVYGSAPAPQPTSLFKCVCCSRSKLTDQDMQIYKYDTDKGFYNDCGLFAEFLMSKDRKYLDPECEETRMKSAGILLAKYESFTGTLRKTKGLMQDADTSPKICEAYFMGRTKKSPSGCNYHFATVVANDGDDNITCEADAGDEKKTEPCFDIYGSNKQSFFDTYSPSYSCGTQYPAFATTAHYYPK